MLVKVICHNFYWPAGVKNWRGDVFDMPEEDVAQYAGRIEHVEDRAGIPSGRPEANHQGNTRLQPDPEQGGGIAVEWDGELRGKQTGGSHSDEAVGRVGKKVGRPRRR